MSDRQGSYISRDSHHVSLTWKVSKGLRGTIVLEETALLSVNITRSGVDTLLNAWLIKS